MGREGVVSEHRRFIHRISMEEERRIVGVQVVQRFGAVGGALLTHGVYKEAFVQWHYGMGLKLET